MRIYIIHPSDTEENYIDRIISAEQKLIEEGHHVLNPLPDDDSFISNKDLHLMYMHLICDCDAAYVMDGCKSDIGSAELEEMTIRKKTIMFEKQNAKKSKKSRI